MLARLASALGLAALAAFAYRAHEVWVSRPVPLDVRDALAHPHLLEITRADRRVLFVSAAVALLCFAAIPLLRAGACSGARTWRGALVAAAVVAVVLMAGAEYRYKHPSSATRCFPVTVSSVHKSICRPQPDKPQAIRQAKALGFAAAGLVLMTLAVPLVRSRRRVRLT